MFKEADRKEARERCHLRARKKVFGTPERPRLPAYRSKKNTYAQIIDDVNAVILVAASSLGRTIEAGGSNKETAKLVGGLVTKRVIEKGVNDIAFDRGGYVCHGRVEALASGARGAGSRF